MAVAGFIDYDGEGRPFMGLLIDSGQTQTKVYLAHKDKAFEVSGELRKQLQRMASDLVATPDKIVPVTGNVEAINNGAIRRP